MKDVAVTTYIDNQANMITEFGWLYRSWFASSSWRTSQIVAFHHPAIDKALFPEDSGITYIPLVPLTEREPEWANYKFINSTHFLTTPEAAQALSKFTYVLKTDNDCFLTPYFPTLRPRLATFGIGLYALDPTVAAKLVQIAAKWGITPVFNSVGSSFMAYPDIALQYAQVHLEYCRKLAREEFPDGYGKWPGWYFGVLTMYAGNLAANAVFGTGLTMGGLDVHCMAHTKMCETDYHIHAWHTFDDFSKFKWREGKYKDFDMSKLDKDCIADYCLWIAGNGPCE